MLSAMSAKPNDVLYCWSCQVPLAIDTTVFIGDVQVPCCTKCWQGLTIEQRLRVGQMFADRADGGVIEAVATVFRSSLGRFIEESGGQDWLRGRGN